MEESAKTILIRSLRNALRSSWRGISIVITLLAIGWVVYQLTAIWPTLALRLEVLHSGLLVCAFLLILAFNFFGFLAFAVLANVFGIVQLRTVELAHLYFTGQLLKHLPGRVWGIGYHWLAGGSAGTLKAWMASNVSHMLVAIYVALGAALCVLLSGTHPSWFPAALVFGVLLYFLLWSAAGSRWLMATLAVLPQRVGTSLLEAVRQMSLATMRSRAAVLLLLSVGSICLYAGWWCFGAASPSISEEAAVRLCAMYMIAWFVGFVSVVSPSGLGVREIVFAWIAQDFSADVVALMAILGRVSLLAGDILLGLGFSLSGPQRASPPGA